MKLLDRFRAAAEDAYQADGADPELVPAAWSQACVMVLPIAGASISLTGDLRVPLGASDTEAARAERLQTTLGEGPCLTAAAAATPLRAGLDTIAARWPIFHHEFIAQTSYQSVVSVPLLAHDGVTGLGAMDLYLTSPEEASAFFVSQVTTAIAAPVSSMLFNYGRKLPNPYALPPWLDNTAVNRRMRVWVAVGILREHAHVSNDTALAALRGYAFSHHETLDDTAAQLMTQQVRPESVLSTSNA